MNEPVQVGDGFETYEPPKPMSALDRVNVVRMQQYTRRMTEAQRNAAIEAAMSNQAVNDVLVGKIGPLPKLPVIDPNSELGQMWAAARAAND